MSRDERDAFRARLAVLAAIFGWRIDSSTVTVDETKLTIVFRKGDDGT